MSNTMTENTGFHWGNVLANALSTFIAATFIGAGIIVWNAASTMDHKINDAKGELNRQQSSISGTQEVLKKELSALKTDMEILQRQIGQIQTQLAEANAAILPSIKKDNPDWQGFTKPEQPTQLESSDLELKNLDRLDSLLQQYKLDKPLNQ